MKRHEKFLVIYFLIIGVFEVAGGILLIIAGKSTPVGEGVAFIMLGGSFLLYAKELRSKS